MKARVGDRILAASNRLDEKPRDGKIVRLHHADGSPPYAVEWSDTGRVTLVFPGPDARVEHLGGDSSASPAAGTARRTKTWRVTIDLFESDDQVSAHAILLSEAPDHLDARGFTSLPPTEEAVPEISEEVAAGRALQRLGEHLLATAASDRSILASSDHDASRNRR
jgi:hypothetical protein